MAATRIPRDAQRMNGLETAWRFLGSQAALAEAMGIGVRLLQQKMAAERPITDDEVRAAARAVTARARAADDFAARLVALVEPQVAK